MIRRVFLVPGAVMCVAFAACERSGPSATAAQTRIVQDTGQTGAGAGEVPGRAAADLRILFIGNSHTSYHQLPKRIEAMLEKGERYDRVDVSMSIGGFLADHAESKRTLDLIADGPWDIVVLQAQKYSQSGKYTYPHDGAIKLTKLAQDGGAKVLMYPEWGQRSRDGEGERIHKLHEEIAEETGAQVVPVGLAWDKALAGRPELVLHAADGNHSTPAGAYLTACVFACWLTESDLSRVGATATPTGMDADTRTFLQETAWETVEEHLPANLNGDGDDTSANPSDRARQDS